MKKCPHTPKCRGGMCYPPGYLIVRICGDCGKKIQPGDGHVIVAPARVFCVDCWAKWDGDSAQRKENAV
jgi:hypothetical protein